MAYTDAAPALAGAAPLPMPDMMGMGVAPALAGPPPPVKMYDVKIKRCIKSGKLKCVNFAPEDFLIDPNALKIDDEAGRFYGDRTRMTRSEAKLKWPDKKDIIDKLPAYTSATDESLEKQARDTRTWWWQDVQTDAATEEIEVIEAFVLVDYDGDGIAEWRKVCIGGNSVSENTILANEEWSGPLPYVAITPAPVPHRYRGRSIYDDIGPIQRVKTSLMRQQLNNLYLTNHPQIAVNQAMIENMDAVLNPGVGEVIRVNGNPADAIVPIVIPFVAEKAFTMLEYWDMVMEKRTGVSRSSMALDTDTLQYQTAEAVKATRSSAFSKVETYARNIAECGGFRELFSKILKLYVANQKAAKDVLIRDKWVRMDPRSWNAEMKVTINIGLGAGSKEQDLATLGGIAQKQEQAVQALGDPMNPMLNVGHVFETYRKMVEIAGIKSPQQYFPEVTQEQVQQIAQQKAQNPPPNPEMLKIQGEMQVKQMEIAAKQKSDENRAQLDQRQAEQKAQIEQIQGQADIAVNREKVQAQIAMDREKMRMEMAMREREFQLESELKMLEFRTKMATERAKIVAMVAKPQPAPVGGEEGGEGRPNGQNGQNGHAAVDMSAVLESFDNAMPMLGEESDMMKGFMQQQMTRDEARAAQTNEVLLQLAQSLQQLSAAMMAPSELVRDPKTDRPIGSRKVV